MSELRARVRRLTREVATLKRLLEADDLVAKFLEELEELSKENERLFNLNLYLSSLVEYPS